MPNKLITRREIIKTFGIGTAATLSGIPLPGFVLAQQVGGGNQLKIPQLLSGSESNGTKSFQLNFRPGISHFFPGISTPTLGINGDYLGPTLRYHNGDHIQMQVHNTIGQPTAVHWHGLHVPARVDGGPTHSIAHGSVWEPSFTIKQKASTCWYHSHILHKTGEQIYHGLAGMIIIDDDEIDALNLPSNYGIDDIPLIVQDRAFKEDGTLRFVSNYGDVIKGMHGDTILVNGTVSPYFTATTKLVRFRILNAANARTFNFAFSDKRAFHQIASDGGLLEHPVQMENLILAPAERAEIIVDFSDGNEVDLVSLPKQTDYPIYPGEMSVLMRQMNTEGFDILAIRPQARLNDVGEIPANLTHIVKHREEDSVQTRRIELVMGHGSRSGLEMGPGTGNRDGTGGGFGGGNFSINGRHMAETYINERIRLGDTEIWELINRSPMMHPFHVHNVQFQILSRNAQPPQPGEQGLKDTVCVHSDERVRIIMRFEDFSDPDIPYMYHCHNLEHEDRGMMGQFLVI